MKNEINDRMFQWGTNLNYITKAASSYKIEDERNMHGYYLVHTLKGDS